MEGRDTTQPIWVPSPSAIAAANISAWMADCGFSEYLDFYHWSITDRADFWQSAIERLNIKFRQPPSSILDTALGEDQATWCRDARLNIIESCFSADDQQCAIVAQAPGGALRRTSYGGLRSQVNQVSNSIVRAGYLPGDALAVVLPMTERSVVLYLGIIQAGCVVVSIADSFAPPEIATRLEISNAVAVFTYDHQLRSGKQLSLFEKVTEASDIPAVVIPTDGHDRNRLSVALRPHDQAWCEFLVEDSEFDAIATDAGATINVLFSSGTTGAPKAIPWSQITPIRCALDGYCHQDIHPQHVCAWPTNLGWMMGPWLIFATLVNRGTIALYEDVPTGPEFGQFVEQAKVNMLGVVPTLVRSWRQSSAMEAYDWSAIHLFSSTGESSQVDDMRYLSRLGGGRPIIEYCGGTEIGGGYVSSVVVLPNLPAAFNTPAVGHEFVLLNSDQQPSDEGEVFLTPPSLGLSCTLLNRDHHATYYAGTPSLEGMPVLRRHGDYFRRVTNEHGQFYYAGGRIDDTMNLGGMKISSAEIERVLNQLDGIRETAAVAVTEQGGPDSLVVFAVPNDPRQLEILENEQVALLMNQRLKSKLNPLFKVSRVVLIDSMPRTASNKIMRRKLRDQV